MNRKSIKIILFVFVSTIFISGCGKSHPRTIYRLACEAVRNHTNFPSNAEILPARETQIQVCKNICRVDVPCRYTDSSVGEKKLIFTVWLKDYAHSWVVDRCYQVQFYTDSSTNQTGNIAPTNILSATSVSNTQ